MRLAPRSFPAQDVFSHDTIPRRPLTSPVFSSPVSYLSLVSPGQIDNKTGETPMEQLEAVYSVIPGLIEMKNQL